MITVPCAKCGAAIPLPADEVSRVECPGCGEPRELRWFRGPRAWEKWQNWALFERPRREALAQAQAGRRR